MTQAERKSADTTEPVEAPTASVGRDVLVERRPLTVLAGSIVGVPPSATEPDPEELLDTIAALYRACTNAIKRYDGFVTHLPDDTFLAYFGYPAAHEDDPERAVRAGLNLFDIIDRFESPSRLQIRIGIATGVVVIGDAIGEGEERQLRVVGTAPSLATRLQPLAPPNTVLIAENTQRQIGAFFALEDAGSQLPGHPPRRGLAGAERAARPGPVRGVTLRRHAAGRTGRRDGSARQILDPSKGR
ncbi:MAG TPA: adenylate/guanylate cyclase domain-containing protein [Stellaceae bacterium]|nr:adenylate/guanylate cyclase domain-containing protein [Stellaceae bacterium]